MLIKWESLPEQLKNEEVEEYYNILKKRRVSLLVKRVFDIVVSMIMIVVLSPILLGLSLWIKIDSRGPVFYRQVRITAGGKKFRIFKFRTMVVNADEIGALITAEYDSRITKAGSKLRKCRLDELPQLFNIFLGEMSFVGTRPEVMKYVSEYTDEMKATLLLPAGVTSLASVCYKDEDEIMAKYLLEGKTVDEAYVEHVLPDKMKYNLEYLKECNFWGDIVLMIKTVISVLK